MPADPQEIQREIEATRAELASTVEAIADRVSPKKVAARGAAAAKEKASDTASRAKDSVEQVFAPEPTPAPAQPTPLAQRVKWERVAAAAAALVALVAAVRAVRSRGDDQG